MVVVIVAGLLGGCTSPPLDVLQVTTVTIDPGHGGPRCGVVGPSGVLEKDVTLRIGLALEEILKSWGVHVVMTRENDIGLAMEHEDDLAARRRMAFTSNADLLLSIHSSYCNHSEVRGFEVWVPKGVAYARDGQNRDLACRIRSNLVRVWGQHDRGTKDDHNLQVLKEPGFAAALVEVETLSNPGVERELRQPSVHRRVAQALAEAIRDWALARGDTRWAGRIAW
jgi:N-acetylmuramoyl-L-alanine amidase